MGLGIRIIDDKKIRSSHAKKKERLALDSNVFRKTTFINYLRQEKSNLEIFFPSIVYLEVGYYHLRKGISWENFLEEIQKINGSFLGWDSIEVSEVLKNAVANKSTLPFREHIRDFLIGTQCERLKLNLITYNKNHFVWVKNISLLTPEEFVQNRENK